MAGSNTTLIRGDGRTPNTFWTYPYDGKQYDPEPPRAVPYTYLRSWPSEEKIHRGRHPNVISKFDVRADYPEDMDMRRPGKKQKALLRSITSSESSSVGGETPSRTPSPEMNIARTGEKRKRGRWEDEDGNDVLAQLYDASEKPAFEEMEIQSILEQPPTSSDNDPYPEEEEEEEEDKEEDKEKPLLSFQDIRTLLASNCTWAPHVQRMAKRSRNNIRNMLRSVKMVVEGGRLNALIATVLVSAWFWQGGWMDGAEGPVRITSRSAGNVGRSFAVRIS
jgi:hypothetical protein